MYRLVILDREHALAVCPADPSTVLPSAVTYVRMCRKGGLRPICPNIGRAIHALGADEPLPLHGRRDFHCPLDMAAYVAEQQKRAEPCNAIA